MIIRLSLYILFAVLPLAFTSCSLTEPKIDDGVITSEKEQVRSSTALVANKLAELQRGDNVEILERQENWLRIRVPGNDPIEGWINARHVASKQVVDQAWEIFNQARDVPAQAVGALKRETKLRLSPDRTSEENVIALLPSGTRFEIIAKTRTERKREARADAGEGNDSTEEGPIRYDTWYQIRLPQEFVIRAGWVYSYYVELKIPDEISALESAGRKFVAWQSFGSVQDEESGEVHHYVILEKTIFKPDAVADFDRIYTVVWDPIGHAYNSIYVESNIRGKLPMKITKLQGGRASLALTLLDKENNPSTVNYTIRLENGRYRMEKARSKR